MKVRLLLAVALVISGLIGAIHFPWTWDLDRMPMGSGPAISFILADIREFWPAWVSAASFILGITLGVRALTKRRGQTEKTEQSAP